MTQEYVDPLTVEIMRDLLDNQVNPKVEEHLFVSRYLPILADQTGKAPKAIWMTEVSQHPYNPVDVMANGKLVITVPPMARRISFNDASVGENVYEIVSTAALKMRLSPQMGTQFMQAALESKVRTIDDRDDLISKWNAVYQHYGYPLLTGVSGEVKVGDITTATTTPAMAKPVATEYEDF